MAGNSEGHIPRVLGELLLGTAGSVDERSLVICEYRPLKLLDRRTRASSASPSEEPRASSSAEGEGACDEVGAFEADNAGKAIRFRKTFPNVGLFHPSYL